MKFIVSSSAFLKQLQQISGVVSANTVLPILEDFLLEIEDGMLTIVGTDLETVMKVRLKVDAKENGKVCIPARILLDSLKNISEQPLTFDIDEHNAIEITSENGKYKVMGENPDNFPKEPDADNGTSFTMKSDALLTAINKTLYAVSTDDLRPAMTGVFFELAEDSICFVATDAHKLIKYTRSDVSCPKAHSFIVPRKPLNLLKNALPNNEDELTLTYNKSHLFVKHDNMELVCRLIDARFPDYRVVIPVDNPYTLTVNKNDFQGALRRVNVFSNKSTNLVTIDITGSEMQLLSQDVDFSFEGNERMACQFDGEDLKMAFNAKFLVEMLNGAETESVNIELSTPTRAGIIKPTEQEAGEELLMLVMPLMIS